MIDKMLSGGAAFDWLSPTFKLLGDLAHGGGYTLAIPACDVTPRDIEKMLRSRGVQTWGLMHVDGTTMITVQHKSARWAEHLLKQAGIPVENPPKGPTPQRARKAQGRRRSGGVFGVFDIFD